MDKTYSRRLKTSIIDETKKFIRIKQSTFRNGVSNLFTHRCQNKSSRDKLEFFIPIKQDNTKQDPSYFLEQKLHLTLRNSNSSVQTFRKKERSCETRKNLVDMMNWLHSCLESLQNMSQEETASQQSTFDYLQKVYSACMLELIQTTRKECTERAQILELVWSNMMDLSKWLEQYFKKKFTTYTNKLMCKSDEQTRKHLFTIDELQNEVKRLYEDIDKRQKFFYQVVKDNRLLRQRNNKLLMKLKFQVEGNVALKEQNLIFYKENEKMKMILSQEIDVKSIEVLTKRIKEIEKSLLTRKHTTKKSLMNEIKEKEITAKFQEQIKVIIKRINEEDVLDLEYQEQQAQLYADRQVYQNTTVQTEKIRTEDKCINTYQYNCNRATVEVQVQTIPTCKYIERVYSMKMMQYKPEQQNSTSNKTVNQSSRQRRVSPTAPSQNALRRSSNINQIFLKGEFDQSAFFKKLEEVPRDYQDKITKLNNIYYIITKSIDALRMNITGMASFEQVRAKQDTRLNSGRALNQMKKLFISEGISVMDKLNQTKVGVFPRHNKSSELQSHIEKRRSKQISIKNAQQLSNIFKMGETEESFDNNWLGSNFQNRKNVVSPRVIYERSRKQEISQEKPRSTNTNIRKSIFKTFSDSQNQSNQATSKNLQATQGYVQPYHLAKLMSMREKKLQEEKENSPIISLSVTPVRRSLQQHPKQRILTQQPVLQAELESEEESSKSSMSCSEYSDMIVQSQIDQTEKRQLTQLPPTARVSGESSFNPTFTPTFTMPQCSTQQIIQVSPPKARTSKQQKQQRQQKQHKKSLQKKKSQKDSDKFKIVNNFKSREDIVNYFNKAAGKEIPTTSAPQIEVAKRQQLSAHVDKNLTEEIQNALDDRSFTVDSNYSTNNNKSAISTINAIINTLEKSMIDKLRAQQQARGQSKSTTLYGRNMLKKLFNFILKEVYRQRQPLLSKQCDFKYFLQHWILYRYGLNELCQQVTSKIRLSLDKFKSESPEFRCMSLLLSNKSQKYVFRKGIFRILVLFVQYGVDNCELLKQNGDPSVQLSKYQQFLAELLSVFYNYEDIMKFVNFVINKYESTIINPFTLFQQIYWFIQKTSSNSQLSSLIKCLCELPGYSHQQLTLEGLVNLWSVLEPNQNILENGFIKLLKFARLQPQQVGKRLSIPVYMLVLLSKKYGWGLLINPIQQLSVRYEQHFNKMITHQQILTTWQLERQTLNRTIPECSSFLQLLDSRMNRYKAGLSKTKPQSFPTILYQFVKLSLAGEVFRQHQDSFIDRDLDCIQMTANRLLRKKQAMEMFG